MKEDKRLFLPCPKCGTKNYEWDTLTSNEKEGLWLFNVKCKKCKHIFSNKTQLNKKYDEGKAFDAVTLAKQLLNPKNLAKMVKSTQEEIDNES